MSEAYEETRSDRWLARGAALLVIFSYLPLTDIFPSNEQLKPTSIPFIVSAVICFSFLFILILRKRLFFLFSALILSVSSFVWVFIDLHGATEPEAAAFGNICMAGILVQILFLGIMLIHRLRFIWSKRTE